MVKKIIVTGYPLIFQFIVDVRPTRRLTIPLLRSMEKTWTKGKFWVLNYGKYQTKY